MGKTITIHPVTKVEGHGKVTLQLDDKNEVTNAYLHIVEFRGFEKFCEGRLFWEMPVITPRICGICPISHHLASAKACDDLVGVDIPKTAKMLRELMHMGQIIQSHTMHFFYLAGPDFVLGPDSDPAKRNVVGIIEANPELGKKAIRVRRIGQSIIERVGGRTIHPPTAIPGGMTKALTHEERFVSQQELKDALVITQEAIAIAKTLLGKYSDVVKTVSVFNSNHMGMVKNGALELYDGNLRLVDGKGTKLEEFDPKKYLDYIGEHVEDWSYMKFPFYKKQGYPNGSYRVGPLGRLNVADKITTPLANAEFQLFRELSKGPVPNNFYYHYARLIEALYAVERAQQLLADDDIISQDIRVKVERKGGEGVGVIEAPRGTLIHHYQADDSGKLTKVNLIVATVHNNYAMNQAVTDAAKKFVKGDKIQEGALNMVEMAIRCFDPCLSCATHAVGEMPLIVELCGPDGALLDTVRRG